MLFITHECGLTMAGHLGKEHPSERSSSRCRVLLVYEEQGAIGLDWKSSKR